MRLFINHVVIFKRVRSEPDFRVLLPQHVVSMTCHIHVHKCIILYINCNHQLKPACNLSSNVNVNAVSCAEQGRSWMMWSVCWEETPPAPAPPSPPTTRCPFPPRPVWRPGACPRAPAQLQTTSARGRQVTKGFQFRYSSCGLGSCDAAWRAECSEQVLTSSSTPQTFSFRDASHSVVNRKQDTTEKCLFSLFLLIMFADLQILHHSCNWSWMCFWTATLFLHYLCTAFHQFV